MDRWSEAGRALLYCDVCEVISRYARAFDRGDWALLRTVYHADAIDDHGWHTGSPDEFIEIVKPRYRHVVNGMHLNGNVLILEVDAERREVLAETYCVGWQRLSAEAEEIPPLYATPLIDESVKSRLCAVGNRYVDLLSERDGELRFAHRKVIYDWVQVSEYPMPGPFGPEWPQGSRMEDDASHTTLDDMRREHARLAGRADG